MKPTEILEASKIFEQSGFRFIWVSESVGVDAFSVLGSIATETKQIRLGTGVVNVYSRSPAQVAMAAATINELSFGRFTLGIGAGSKGVVSNWHGLNFENQLQRVETYIQKLKSMLEKNELQTVLQQSSRVQGSKVPIIVAAVREKMILLAREKADGILFFMRPLPNLKRDAERLAPGSFRVCANVVTCVSRKREVAERRARRTVAFYITYGDSYRKFLQTQQESPQTKQLVTKIRELWLQGKKDDASRFVPQDLLDQVSIYGTPEECRRAIEREYTKIKGLSMLGFQFNPCEPNLKDSINLLTSLAFT
jgi:5,10-methylenetetrahydromethanopterin reductase